MPAILLFAVVSLVYMYTAYQLIKINNSLGAKRNIGRGIIHTNNDYARLCYIVLPPCLPHPQGLGKPGFYLFNFALLMIFYGACIGTMIVMTDFMASLPIMSSSPTAKRYLMQILLTVTAILLCLLKDPGVLVRISSFGLLALIVSFVLLFVYCFACGALRWQSAYLFPLSLKAFLNNFGVFVYSLGITPLLFTQLVSTVPLFKRRSSCSGRTAGKP